MPFKDPQAYRDWHRTYMREKYIKVPPEERKAKTFNQAEYMRKYKEENREKMNKQRRDWAYRHPEKVRHSRSLRKARVRGATVGVVDVAKLILEWNRICGICSEFVYTEFDIDHIIPITKGGKHEQSNLQLTHSICNQRKGNRI